MQQLMALVAGSLGKSVDSSAELKLDEIIHSAQEMLLADRVRWFSLPPVLSAWRIDRERYDYEFRSLCTALNLEPTELRDCASSNGILPQDPVQVPMWAMALWTVSKNVVNHMLNPPPAKEERFDVPPRVLPANLVSQMGRALGSGQQRGPSIRKWFEDSRDWIGTTPLDDRYGHAGVAHR